MPIVDPQLREHYSELHKTQQYGGGASRFSLHIQACIADLKPSVIIDYGCGQSHLEAHLCLGDVEFHRYDPAIPGLATLNVESADLLINTDVLEHIPANDIPDILQHMRSLGPNIFFNIATRKASQILPNGENAHCTIWPATRWLQAIRRVFPDAQLVAEYPGNSCLIVTWKSPILRLLSGIEQLKIVERQRNEFKRPPLRRLWLSVRRFLRNLRTPVADAPILYPDTIVTESAERTLHTV